MIPFSFTFTNTYSTDSALCTIIIQYLWISGLRLLLFAAVEAPGMVLMRDLYFQRRRYEMGGHALGGSG